MQDQFESNFVAFKRILPSLLADHRNEFALLHQGDVVDFYLTSFAAVESGLSRFGEDNFSVEEVTDRVEDLGFYSYVGSALQA